MDAINEYIAKTNRRVTFEYIMLDHERSGGTSTTISRPSADKKRSSYVNLPLYQSSWTWPLERSGKERVVAFYDVLKKTTSTVSFVKNSDMIWSSLRTIHVQAKWNVTALKNKSNKLDEPHFRRGWFFAKNQTKVDIF